MSISAREQQALNSIKDGLAGSDPELATLLATFAEQASGEEMPARENIRMTPRWRILRYVLVLWLLITVWLIAVALALSPGSGHVLCAECYGRSPGRRHAPIRSHQSQGKLRRAPSPCFTLNLFHDQRQSMKRSRRTKSTGDREQFTL